MDSNENQRRKAEKRRFDQTFREDLNKSIAHLEELADSITDGHVTLLRFTTGWKVLLGSSPTVFAGGNLNKIPGYMDIDEAISYAIDNNSKYDSPENYFKNKNRRK
jgi:hypothetical protein